VRRRKYLRTKHAPDHYSLTACAVKASTGERFSVSWVEVICHRSRI